MAQFSRTSLEKLGTCDQRLVDLMRLCIQETDFTVICGYRGEEEQNKAFAEGKSKLKYPHGKHNSYPSKAVDIAPCKYDSDRKMYIDWEDKAAFKSLAEIVLKYAEAMNIPLTWGGSWKIQDLPHFELKC